MKKNILSILTATLAINAFFACNDIGDYSVSPNHLLSFSADTVSFDTVFTTVGSTTGYFMIYNKNDEALKIETIILAGGSESNFRINIDGRKGDIFHEIPIWKQDSLYVAVEVTVDPNNETQPFVIHDSIVFTTNGMRQAVLLEAYGQNAHILKGGTVFAKDTTLTADLPYLVYDSVTVADNATLTIDKGANFYMHKDAKWLINGTIKANGTQSSPIVFRGDRLDDFSTKISYDRLPSQWDGFSFGASSFDNELNHTLIRNGISGLAFKASTPERQKINISNSQITNMDGNALWAVNCHIEASNTEFSNAGNRLVALEGGKYQFSHCTLANYIRGSLTSSGARFEPSLTLTDSMPLTQAYFDNCIIDGTLSADTTNKYSGEINFYTETYPDGDDNRFNYRFNHCFIKTQRISNERFIENLFVASPAYINANGKNKDDEDDLEYDFRLANESICIGKADRAVSEKYPADRYGVNRLDAANGPSIGAYEYVPQKDE